MRKSCGRWVMQVFGNRSVHQALMVIGLCRQPDRTNVSGYGRRTPVNARFKARESGKYADS